MQMAALELFGADCVSNMPIPKAITRTKNVRRRCMIKGPSGGFVAAAMLITEPETTAAVYRIRSTRQARRARDMTFVPLRIHWRP